MKLIKQKIRVNEIKNQIFDVRPNSMPHLTTTLCLLFINRTKDAMTCALKKVGLFTMLIYYILFLREKWE